MRKNCVDELKSRQFNVARIFWYLMIMNKSTRANKDEYTKFEDLKKNETLYEICFRERFSGVAVIAPHGGKIEPGTSEIARGIAGNEHTFYTFRGLRKDGNKRYLHIGVNPTLLSPAAK